MNDDFDLSLLSGYLDDELTAAEREQVEQMLGSDAALRDELAAMRKLQSTIATLPLPPSQTDLLAGVRDRIAIQQAGLHREDHAATPLSVLKFVMSLAVAACILFAIGWSLLPASNSSPTVAMETEDDVPEETAIKQRGPDESAALPSVAMGRKVDKEPNAGDAGSAERGLEDAMLEMQDTPPPQADSIKSAPADSSGDPRGTNANTRAEPSLGLQSDAQEFGASPRAMMMEAPAAESEPQARIADGRKNSPQDRQPMPSPAEPAMAASTSGIGRTSSANAASPSGLPPVAARASGGMDAAPAETPKQRVAPEPETIRSRTLMQQPQSRSLQMQIGSSPSTETADPGMLGSTGSAAEAGGTTRTLVTTLAAVQLKAAIAWLRKRTAGPGANSQPANLSAEMPVLSHVGNNVGDNRAVRILLNGSPAKLAELEKDWQSYVRSIDGKLAKRQPLRKQEPQAGPTAQTFNDSRQSTAATEMLLIQINVAP